MPFDPATFIQVARDLSRQARGAPAPIRSARIRTAYGRLYYGLFLAVREELARRHFISPRRVRHDLASRLQHSALGRQARELGREMQRLYNLRRQADYEISPPPLVSAELEDAANAEVLAGRALEFVKVIPHLDLTPIVHLF